MFASFNPGHVGISATLSEGLALAEQHGFGGFDAQLAQLHEAVGERGAAAVRDQYLDRGLRFGAWNLPFMPYRVSEDELRDGIKSLSEMLPSACAVGATRCGMWFMPGSDDREYDDNFAFHVERFQPVARLLDDHGVRLGLEFIGPETSRDRFQHPFIRSIPETIELARAIGPNCGLLVDAWHWHCAGGDADDLKHFTCDLLVHIHVDDAPAGIPTREQIDNQRCLPCTTGVIDIDAFMRALAVAGYDGPVTAEPFDKELSALPTEESASRTARTTRAAVARAIQPGDAPTP